LGAERKLRGQEVKVWALEVCTAQGKRGGQSWAHSAGLGGNGYKLEAKGCIEHNEREGVSRLSASHNCKGQETTLLSSGNVQCAHEGKVHQGFA